MTNQTQLTDCTICGKQSQTTHLELYVIGSEGCRVCQPCRIQITQYAEALMLDNLRKRKEVFKARRADKIKAAVEAEQTKSYLEQS